LERSPVRLPAVLDVELLRRLGGRRINKKKNDVGAEPGEELEGRRRALLGGGDLRPQSGEQIGATVVAGLHLVLCGYLSSRYRLKTVVTTSGVRASFITKALRGPLEREAPNAVGDRSQPFPRGDQVFPRGRRGGRADE